MKLDEYQTLAERSAHDDTEMMNYGEPLEVWERRLLDAALGLPGESGEVAELVKKYLFQGKPLDRDRVIEELGDVLWYVVEGARAMGVTLEEVAERNITKLRARYPKSFEP